MRLTRCKQGHFYDMEKFETCPHCRNTGQADQGLTSLFSGDETESIGINKPAKTEKKQAQPVISAEVIDFNDLPDMEPSSSLTDSDETQTLAGLVSHQASTAPEDRDETVGFYDRKFFGAGSKNDSSEAAAAVTNVTNRVKTPCVGWLVAVSGKYIGTDFRLNVGKNYVGRSPQMDIALIEDRSVSRKSQAIVVYEPKTSTYLVQSGESNSLLYKNGDVVLTPEKLEAYDILSVGDTDLVFIPLCNSRFNWNEIMAALKNRE